MPKPDRFPRPALFLRLLGDRFAALPASIRAVHSVEGRRVLRGSCRVVRGRHLLARLVGAAMSLPQAGDHPAIEVIIEASGACESWTRCIGASRMRSRLCAAGTVLVESMGPAQFHFELESDAGAIRWRLRRVLALGMPLPLRWCDMEATESMQGSLYRFEVRAALAGALLVVYDGTLEAPVPP